MLAIRIYVESVISLNVSYIRNAKDTELSV